MVPHHHAGQFLPKQNVFPYDYDFTLIASVMGESVIGHGIDGILIPAKWPDLLKASHRSKQQQKLGTQSYSHSNRLMV